MNTFERNEPLTDVELDRLGDFLVTCEGNQAMNIEELDGFFAALIAGPKTVMPSEYNPEVFGGEMSEACEFGSIEEANEILGLLMLHWNNIAGTLFKGEVYVPLLFEDEDGTAHGNDWARGFMRGVEMRTDSWAELIQDEDHGACLLPMMMLFHEHVRRLRDAPRADHPAEARNSHCAHGDRVHRSLSLFSAAPPRQCRKHV